MTIDTMFRLCGQFARSTDARRRWSRTNGSSGEQHPAAASDRAQTVLTDGAADADEQRIAAALAEIAQAGLAGDLVAAQHTSLVLDQDIEDRPLLRCQVLEGARDLTPSTGHRRSGAVHVATVDVVRFVFVGGL